MKRISLIVLFLGLCTRAHAGLLDLPNYVSPDDVTINNLSTTNTSIENWANGNVEGGVNIKPGSLVSQDFAASVSIVTYRDEAFNDFTFTGMLPATDNSDLSSDISAGTSYVAGYRVVKNAEAHTYSASKDTYVWINKGGYYVYEEVANGASAPSTPTPTADHLLLAKVVTDADNITSVGDLRTTSIQITTTTTNFPTNYRNGATLSWDTTTTLHVEPGEVAIGSTIYSRTTDTSSKVLSTSTNWIEGSVPSLSSGGNIYVYAYNDAGSSWDFKYSSVDPVASDTSGNTNGTLRYYTTGGTTYRAIGWAYASADAVQSSAFGNIPDVGIRNRVVVGTTTYMSSTVSTPAVDDSIPLTSEGMDILTAPFYVSNPNSRIAVTCNVNTGASAGSFNRFALFRDSTAVDVGGVKVTGSSEMESFSRTKTINSAARGSTTFKLRGGSGGGGATIEINGTGGSRAFGGISESTITIEEIQ